MQSGLKLFFIAGVASLIVFGFSMAISNENKSYAEGSGDGESLFKTNCLGCHSIGEGKRIGPDLVEVAKVRDREWLTKMIVDPQALLDSGDPEAKKLVKEYGMVMPKVKLSDSEIASIVAYLEAVSALDMNAAQAGGATPGASSGGAIQLTTTTFALYGVLGALLLFALAGGVWRGRLRGVRKSLR